MGGEGWEVLLRCFLRYPTSSMGDVYCYDWRGERGKGGKGRWLAIQGNDGLYDIGVSLSWALG